MIWDLWIQSNPVLKELLAVMGLIGIPSIFSMTIWCVRRCNQYTQNLKVLMKAEQADMRKDLLQDYDYYIEGGWISTEHLDDWENRYQAYHTLGANGVMDSKRVKLFQLPSHPPAKRVPIVVEEDD